MVPRIPAMAYREVERLLRAHGFHPLRQAGSHVVFKSSDGRKTVVPRRTRHVPAGLVAKILQQAGIDSDEVRR